MLVGWLPATILPRLKQWNWPLFKTNVQGMFWTCKRCFSHPSSNVLIIRSRRWTLSSTRWNRITSALLLFPPCLHVYLLFYLLEWLKGRVYSACSPRLRSRQEGSPPPVVVKIIMSSCLSCKRMMTANARRDNRRVAAVKSGTGNVCPCSSNHDPLPKKKKLKQAHDLSIFFPHNIHCDSFGLFEFLKISECGTTMQSDSCSVGWTRSLGCSFDFWLLFFFLGFVYFSLSGS